jgi:uncharacterized membrane protein YraQ (UPF0718 family)
MIPDNSLILGSFTGLSLLLSYISDREKTVLGLKKGGKMLYNISHQFINILIIVSIVLFFIPDNLIMQYLGANSGWKGFGIAALTGSVTLIPGLVSYPLASALLDQGAAYSVVAVFITSLMMVGVVTLPLEIKYFGRKTSLLRNLLNLISAMLIGLFIGWLM